VASHPYMVSLHQDVIIECLDDPDISIRMRALDLVVGMVNSDNIVTIVNRLLKQLLDVPFENEMALEKETQQLPVGLYADSEDGDAEEALTKHEANRDDTPPLPDDYRVKVIRNILDMCAKDTYANLTDFEWYIDVLVKLVKACPMIKSTELRSSLGDNPQDISYSIGSELQNIAVRVVAVRSEVTAAAQSLVLIDNRDKLFPSFTNGGQGVLEACGWLVGEYANELTDPQGVLNSLLHSSTTQLPEIILSVHIQAMLKVLAMLCSTSASSWTPQSRTNTVLLVNRVVYFLEPLTNHADMEVQELAVEYLELMRLSSEAASSQSVSHEGEYTDAPLLITQAIPALFKGQELKPVAIGAQRKVEVPDDLDLETPINESLPQILNDAEDVSNTLEHDDIEDFYYNQEEVAYVPESAAERLDLAAKTDPYSYQNSEEENIDPGKLARMKAERRERNKDDPFYIGAEDESSRLHNIIKNTNGDDLDLDSIPVMDLDLEGTGDANFAAEREQQEAAQQRRKANRKKVKIIADETLGDEEPYGSDSSRNITRPSAIPKGKKSLLNIDSSGLGSLSLDGNGGAPLDIEQRAEEEKALKEVERLRLEMQRASERIQAKEETVVKRKKKKPKATTLLTIEGEADSQPVVKKKKKKTVVDDAADGEAVTKKKKKKKARIVELGDEPPAQQPDGPSYVLE
jgi:AP-3 complex subunit delta-1